MVLPPRLTQDRTMPPRRPRATARWRARAAPRMNRTSLLLRPRVHGSDRLQSHEVAVGRPQNSSKRCVGRVAKSHQPRSRLVRRWALARGGARPVHDLPHGL
jgi:hypothetical protein